MEGWGVAKIECGDRCVFTYGNRLFDSLTVGEHLLREAADLVRRPASEEDGLDTRACTGNHVSNRSVGEARKGVGPGKFEGEGAGADLAGFFVGDVACDDGSAANGAIGG